jgi:hypothetical protein
MYATALMGIFRLKSDPGPPLVGIGVEPPLVAIGSRATVS